MLNNKGSLRLFNPGSYQTSKKMWAEVLLFTQKNETMYKGSWIY